MINNAPTINRTKLCIFLRNVKKHIDYYSTLSEEQKNNSLKKAIIESYTKESTSQLGYYKRLERPIPLNEESLQLLPKEMQQNKVVAKKIISNNPNLFKFLENNLKLDDELIKLLFDNVKNEKLKEIILNEIDSYFPGFLTDKDICLKVCKIAVKCPSMANTVGYSLFPIIPTNIKTDKDFIYQLLHEDYTLYKYIEAALKEDFHIMIDSMKISEGKVFYYFHPDLRSDLFFSYYMSQFGEIEGDYLSGDLKKQYLKSHASSANSFLNSLMLKEKLDKKLVYKSLTKEKTKKI